MWTTIQRIFHLLHVCLSPLVPLPHSSPPASPPLALVLPTSLHQSGMVNPQTLKTQRAYRFEAIAVCAEHSFLPGILPLRTNNPPDPPCARRRNTKIRKNTPKSRGRESDRFPSGTRFKGFKSVKRFWLPLRGAGGECSNRFVVGPLFPKLRLRRSFGKSGRRRKRFSHSCQLRQPCLGRWTHQRVKTLPFSSRWYGSFRSQWS